MGLELLEEPLFESKMIRVMIARGRLLRLEHGGSELREHASESSSWG